MVKKLTWPSLEITRTRTISIIFYKINHHVVAIHLAWQYAPTTIITRYKHIWTYTRLGIHFILEPQFTGNYYRLPTNMQEAVTGDALVPYPNNCCHTNSSHFYTNTSNELHYTKQWAQFVQNHLFGLCKMTSTLCAKPFELGASTKSSWVKKCRTREDESDNNFAEIPMSLNSTSAANHACCYRAALRLNSITTLIVIMAEVVLLDTMYLASLINWIQRQQCLSMSKRGCNCAGLYSNYLPGVYWIRVKAQEQPSRLTNLCTTVSIQHPSHKYSIKR